MNGRSALYIQAIRGPVLLVSIGVLFAIHQAGVLSFARTWPLLVIVIGVMKLLERAWAPVQPVPGGYPNAGYPNSGYPNTGRYPNTGAYSYPRQAPYSQASSPQSPGSFRQEPPAVPPPAPGTNPGPNPGGNNV
jgi:hypothetical protein